MKQFDLVGVNSNAFSVLAYTVNAMRKTKFTDEEIRKYKSVATSGDYDSLLCFSMQQLDKCNARIALQGREIFAQFGPGKYFIGDICYALPDKIYDEIWGDKYKYEDGFYEEYGFATHRTMFGDGSYLGSDGFSYCVDAGNLGITNITTNQRYDDAELNRLGKTVEVKDSIAMVCGENCCFEFIVDGESIVIATDGSDIDEEDEEDWEEE